MRRWYEIVVRNGDAMKARSAMMVGDWVISYDEHERRQTVSPMTRLYQAESDHYLEMNGLEVTSGYPFASQTGEWITAGDLAEGHQGSGMTAR